MVDGHVSSLIEIMETFGERFRRLRERARLSPTQAAERIGITRQAVYMIESGETKSMESANLLKAAEAFDVSPQELQSGASGPARRTMFARAPEATYQRDIPVVGYVIASPTEDGYFDDMGYPPGAGEGNIPWATRDANAYAVRVRGDSMQPRFRPGEIVVVEPNAAVTPGDDVIVRTREGRRMVKRLLFQRGKEVTLGSVNDRHQPITISLEEIESMHHIAGSVQRGTPIKE